MGKRGVKGPAPFLLFEHPQKRQSIDLMIKRRHRTLGQKIVLQASSD